MHTFRLLKRYYIADIPGLGWLAKFYVTHYMHYIFAILLLAITSYIVIDYMLIKRKRIKITISGYTRVALVAGLVITGILLVIRNLAGSGFSSDFIIFLDLSHLGLVIALLTAGLYSLVFKRQWSEEILTTE
ncbi:MAG: hypothetical protein JRJ65_06490 [Deltaproteobacteria bacterium]|nr:hypothetical protein [Deltaproteobacteria bacterium]